MQFTHPAEFVFVLDSALEFFYLFQQGTDTLVEGYFILGLLVAAASHLFGALDLFIHGIQVRQRQLGIDDFDVVGRRDPPADMHHVIVVEAAYHMDDGIRAADMAEKLVPQALAGAGALHKAGDVDEFDGGWLNLLRIDNSGELIHAWIRHLDDADVGVDGAERIVGRLCAGRGQRVEDG